jgi:hypothetical protein
MKKLILLGLTIILFASCEKKKTPQFMTSSPEINVLKLLLKDYEEGNWTNWAGHYADGARIRHNTIEPITTEELQKNFIVVINNLSDYKFSQKENEIFFEMIVDDKGDNWVYFWGIWKGTVSGVNKELVMPVHIAYKFINGKIDSEYAFYDPTLINNAIIEKQVAEELVEEL